MEESEVVGGEVKDADKQPTVIQETTPAEPADAGVDEIDLEQLPELYEKSFKSFSEGEVVKGEVIAISEGTVVVDIGFKSEGLINKREFNDEEGNLTVAVGDEVEVLLEQTENLEGRLVLSKDKAEKMKVWDAIEEAFKGDEVIEGRVIDRIKGGLAVDVGVRAFLPGSQVDVRPVRNLESFKGEQIRVKVIKFNKRRGNIVISRKEVIEAENKDRKRETIKKLTEGAHINGVVKNLTEYGAFIDLGGIDGLLHITDMSWGRIGRPTELFSVGQEVEVVVLKFDPETDRVSLGYKQRYPDPWGNVGEKYPVDSRLEGKVVSITDYGAFVELEVGVEGLIHVSEMSWSKRVKHPSKLLSVGQQVETVVLDVDPEARRISLGLKQIEPNPWILVREHYREGDVIKGRVRNITDFGAFVEIEEGIDGLIHVSDMSWTKRIKHPSEMLKKGEDVEAIVLHIDVDNQRLSLGLKQMSPNTWDKYFGSHKIGDVVGCSVVRITNFGIFVELDEEGIEGLVHASELGISRARPPEEMFSVGDKLKAKIIKMDSDEKKIGLSIRTLKEDKVEKEKEVHAKKPSSKATLADVLGDQAIELLGGVREKAGGAGKPKKDSTAKAPPAEKKAKPAKAATKAASKAKKPRKTKESGETGSSEPEKKGDEEGS